MSVVNPSSLNSEEKQEGKGQRSTTSCGSMEGHSPMPLRSIRSTRNHKESTPPNRNSTEVGSHQVPPRRSSRSPSIAIQTKCHGHSSSSFMDSFGSRLDEGKADEFSSSYHQRYFDSATWRMYHRIVDHRRLQQTRRIQQSFLCTDSQDVVNASVTGSCRPPTGHFRTSSGGRINQHHPQSRNSSSSSSSSSSVLSSRDDEIFEMEP